MADARATVAALQDELDQTNRGVIALMAELEAKAEQVHAMTSQLWQATKLATIGELAAGIAHELNNPLATIALRVELLLDGAPAGSQARRSLEVVGQEVERMGGLVAGLLDFGRRRAPQVSTLDVAEEADAALELMHSQLRTRGVVVVREYRPGQVGVLADRQQVRQVFLNLFTNAADAMPGGGTLTVRASVANAATAPEAVPALALIEVADTGVGIAADVLPRVTEPFFTTKPEGKGTGLGLAICRRIVSEHGGHLDIDSTPGRGTTVRIGLPSAGRPNPAPLEVS